MTNLDKKRIQKHKKLADKLCAEASELLGQDVAIAVCSTAHIFLSALIYAPEERGMYSRHTVRILDGLAFSAQVDRERVWKLFYDYCEAISVPTMGRLILQ